MLSFINCYAWQRVLFFFLLNYVKQSVAKTPGREARMAGLKVIYEYKR